MAHAAHPGAMKASAPSPTRTAPPTLPPKFPTGGRYLSYMAFGATSFFYLAIALLVLRIAWSLGSGPEAWAQLQAGFQNPIYVGFHAVALVVFSWAAWRFLIKLSAKAQPKKIGPLRPPPAELVPLAAAGGWVVATALVIVVLWGIFP